MRCVCALAFLLAAVPCAAPATGPAAEFTTTQPLDGIEQCFRAQFADTGKVTAINTAGGELLDLSFDSIGADGKVATGHLIFSIEDRGTQRKATVSAPNAADGALANQLLAQAVRQCLPDAAGQRGDAPPPSLLEKKPHRP